MHSRLSQRTIIWWLLIAGVAAFMQITNSEWWRSRFRDDVPEYELTRWPTWACDLSNLSNDSCLYNNAGVVLQMRKQANSVRIIEARIESVFEQGNVSSVDLRHKDTATNTLEREYKFTPKQNRVWELTLRDHELGLSGSKQYQIWITAEKKIFELPLK